MNPKILTLTLGLALFVLTAIPAQAVTLTYIYDALGRLEEVDYSNGIWIYYGYDSIGSRWIYAWTVTRAIRAFRERRGSGKGSPANKKGSLAEIECGYKRSEIIYVAIRLRATTTDLPFAGSRLSDRSCLE